MALARTEDAASTLTGESRRLASRTKDQGEDLASTTAAQAERVATRARQRSRQVARSTAGDARAVASHVRDEAHVVLDEAAGQARRSLNDTVGALEQQTAAQLDRLATQLQGLVAEADALVAGHPEEAERLRDLVEEASQRLDVFADRVQNLGTDIESDGFAVALRDLQDFARRRPGAFLLGALGGGFLVGRLVRSEQSGDGAGSPVRARGVRG